VHAFNLLRQFSIFFLELTDARLNPIAVGF
jgi:hypothetical protein